MKSPVRPAPPTPLGASRVRRAGGTPLRDCPALAERFGLPFLRIKDESENPFGTHKDRKSEYLISRIVETPPDGRPDAICIFTSGNAGLSVASFASRHQIPVVAIVDEHQIASQSLAALREACQKVVSIDAGVRRLTSEIHRWTGKELRLVAGEACGTSVLDATNCAEAYAPLVDELAETPPDVLVLPVGGGELFVGVHDRLQELGWPTRLVGVTVMREDSIADKLFAAWTPYRARIRELCKPASPHRMIVLHDESALRTSYRLVSRFLRCEASSAAAFEALRLGHISPDERLVVINTGCGTPD